MRRKKSGGAALGRIDRPTAVVVGGKDELFYAERYAPLFAELNPKVAVTVEPGFGHLDMVADGRACAAVAQLWQRLQ